MVNEKLGSQFNFYVIYVLLSVGWQFHLTIGKEHSLLIRNFVNYTNNPGTNIKPLGVAKRRTCLATHEV